MKIERKAALKKELGVQRKKHYIVEFMQYRGGVNIMMMSRYRVTTQSEKEVSQGRVRWVGPHNHHCEKGGGKAEKGNDRGRFLYDDSVRRRYWVWMCSLL